MTGDWTILPLTAERMRNHVGDLVAIDRDTLGDRWEASHFLAPFPGKWEFSRLAADIQGCPVGFAVASLKGDAVHINRLAVGETYRGRHIGLILLHSVAESARERSLVRMTLKVARHNTKAIAFYQRMGFTEAGRSEVNLTLAHTISGVLAATVPAQTGRTNSATEPSQVYKQHQSRQGEHPVFLIENKTILAIAPHIDDVELGAGATIHHLAKHNKVHYIGMSLPPLVEKNQFMEEFRVSATHLGLDPGRILLRDYDPRNLFDSRSEILQLFYELNTELRPDLVLIPNSKDIHQSHEVVFAEARRAFKYLTILGYELPWNSIEFSMDVFITVSKEDVDAKIAAINAYKTQKRRMFFSNDIVGDLARVRGKQVGREYAECFELVRLIL